MDFKLKKLSPAPKRAAGRKTASAARWTVEPLERRALLSAVVGEALFYKGSMWDNSGDDAAIAADKSALLPGRTADFSNYSSYSLGINGIVVDISGADGAISAADFSFKVGNSSAVDSWAGGPLPITVIDRPGAGAGGSDRVELIWTDGAIRNEWLQVTVRADAVTGLSENTVFYFGSAIGETGNSPTDTQVTSADESGVRAHLSNILNPAAITNAYDFNRDGKVDAVDVILARNATTDAGSALQLITPNATPTVAVPAAAQATTVTGTTTGLSVLGADDGGEANLTYIWSATSAPEGALPTFSINGSHAARNTVVTFGAAGNYTFLVTISDGTLSTTSSVSLTVTQTLTVISVAPVSGVGTTAEAPSYRSDAAGLPYSGQSFPSSQTVTSGASVDPASAFLGLSIPQNVPDPWFYRSGNLSPVASIPNIFDVNYGDWLGVKMRNGRLRHTLWEALESRLYLSGATPAASSWPVNVSNTANERYRTLPVLQSAIQDGVGGTGIQPQLSSAQNFFNVRKLFPRNQSITVTTPAAGVMDASDTGADLSVAANYLLGESNLTYTWLAQSAPAGATVQFGTNGTNAAKQTHVTFNRAGTYSFLVEISNGPLSISDSVNVQVGEDLSVVGASVTGTQINVGATQQFTASAYDQFGQLMATQPQFNWSVDNGGEGTVNGTGLYTAGNTDGSATVRASVGTISGAATISVVHGAPTVATPAQSGAGTVTGTSTTLSVLGASALGENSLTYSWAMTGGPQGAAPLFADNGDNAAKNTSITFNEAGSYTFLVTISDGSLGTTSSVNVTVAQTLSRITVSPGSRNLNLNGSQGFSATGYDQFTNVLANQPALTWSVDNGGVGSVNASGVYSSGATAGAASVRASSGGISGTASVMVTNAAPSVSIAAQAGASNVTTTSTTLSVLGADDGGESNLTYSWTTTTLPNGATPQFSINGTNASKSATVTFNKAGSYTFLVTISDGTLSTSSSVSVTVAQTLTTITVGPGSQGLNLNASQQFAATAKDQFGAGLSSQPVFGWSVDNGGVGSVNAAGLYTAAAATGTATVRATSGIVSGTAGVTVANGTPTVSTAAHAGAGNVTGASTTLAVLGADDGGEPGLTYTWTLSASPNGATPQFSINGSNAAKNTTVTFNAAGSYSFLVTISDGSLSATSSVSLTVAQTLSGITVSPGSQGLNLNGTQQFSASGMDQFGTALASQPGFSWSVDGGGVGSVNVSGLYSAGTTAGTATVRASVGTISGASTVTVTNAAPTVATGAHSGTSNVLTTSTTLGVLGADDGGESHLTYTWSLTTEPSGATPQFSFNGINLAKNTTVSFNKAGSYTFLVTISDGTLSTTSSVSLTVSQTLTTIGVTPGTASILTNATQGFMATAYDQFSVAMTNQPAFTWTVDSGGTGSVSASGVYTAGASAGNATVRAASGGVSGTASVTVNATGSGVAVTTRLLTSFTELVITGTTGNDTITVSQTMTSATGNTYTIVANGSTQTITGIFGDIAIHAGSGGSTITVQSSVSINTLLYGGAGVDNITDLGAATYNSIVTIGGGTDTVTGSSGINDYIWADTADTINASSADVSAGNAQQLSAFYQPWSSNSSDPNYIPLSLDGQALKDPTDSGTTHRVGSSSLWGGGPQLSDIRQGSLGDCFLLSSIGSIAYSNPVRLYSMVVDLGDGTFAVRFKRLGQYSYVRIDADFAAVQAAASASGGVWVDVIEKAYAYFRTGANTYASLNAGWMYATYQDLGMTAANNLVTAAAQETPQTDATLAAQIQTALQSGAGLTIGTPSVVQDAAPLIASHAYTVVGVYFDSTANTWKLQVRNPWGYDGTGSDGNPLDGIVTITFQQLTGNCTTVVQGS